MPDSTEPIPEYQEALAAYHEAFAPELSARIDALPIHPGDRVLDLACGDGVYSRWLSRRVGPGGLVVAFDLLKAYLELARETVEEAEDGEPGRVAYVSGDVHEPPLRAGSFDLVWCAQSLRSLPDPSAALRVMAGLARPGGVVAVLENDAMHQVLLPWPEGLELALRRAELEALSDAPGPTSKHYIGRWLPRLFTETGLGSVRLSTWAADRHAPLSADERSFLSSYLEGLVERLSGRLPADARAELAELCTPGSPRFLPDQPDLAFTCIDQVVTGTRPAEA